MKIRMIKKINLATLFLVIFFLLFQIDAALGNIAGSISINNYFAILCLICILLSKKVQFSKDRKLTIFFAVYFIFQLVLIMFGPKILSSRNIIFLFYGVFAIVVMNTQWKENELEIFKCAIFFSQILSVCLVLPTVSFGSSGRKYFAIGRNIDQNYFCANFIFATVLLTCSILKVKKKSEKLILISILSLEILTILFLGSRGSLLGNLAAMFVVIWVEMNMSVATVIRKIPMLVTIGCLISVLASLMLPEWMLERFNIINMLNSTGSGRLMLWETYLNYYESGSLINILFGYGRGIVYCYDIVGVNSTHSIYIKALVEGGIVGIVLLIILFREIYLYVKSSGNKTLYAIVIGYLVSGIFLDLDDYRIFPVLIVIIELYKNYNFAMGKSKSVLKYN